MVNNESELGIPYELLQDDNHPQDLKLPTGLGSLPISSAPQYTLYRLLRYIKPTSVLEIGTQFGGSALFMALAFRDNGIDTDIICVDPFYPTGDNDGLDTLRDWYNNMYKSGLKPGVQLVLATSDEILPYITKPFDFVFIDGSHEYQNVRQDCLHAISLLNTGGFFLAHDYVIYKSVKSACDQVIAAYKLPSFVNSLQKNYRGELCGWIIAKKTQETKVPLPKLRTRSRGTYSVGKWLKWLRR